MKKIIYRASERGGADYGWLKANYSFSFANYYDPSKVNFGALRVLNDDIIEGGMGFGTHPHDNMEIISIPLKGGIKHKDSMSEKWISLDSGEVQVMSAGTGIQHSEMNDSKLDEVNLFQIWIMPNEQNVKPRYDQKNFEIEDRLNNLQVLVSSVDCKIEDSLAIHQDALISRIDLEKGSNFEYTLKSENHGVYIMIINGAVKIENDVLNERDAIGISDSMTISINCNSNTELLFIEVPMQF